MEYSSFISVLTDRTTRWNQSVALENKSHIVQIKTKTGRVCGRTCCTTENGVDKRYTLALGGPESRVRPPWRPQLVGNVAFWPDHGKPPRHQPDPTSLISGLRPLTGPDPPTPHPLSPNGTEIPLALQAPDMNGATDKDLPLGPLERRSSSPAAASPDRRRCVQGPAATKQF